MQNKCTAIIQNLLGVFNVCSSQRYNIQPKCEIFQCINCKYDDAVQSKYNKELFSGCCSNSLCRSSHNGESVEQAPEYERIIISGNMHIMNYRLRMEGSASYFITPLPCFFLFFIFSLLLSLSLARLPFFFNLTLDCFSVFSRYCIISLLLYCLFLF